MQVFHLNYIKNKDGDKPELLLTYTDILMYKFKVGNVYEDFYKDKHFFDFSNYEEDSKNYDNAINLVVNKIGFLGFIGLRFKMYTFITVDNNESKKSKGIRENDVDDELKYEDYKYVLFSRSYMRNEMN